MRHMESKSGSWSSVIRSTFIPYYCCSSSSPVSSLQLLSLLLAVSPLIAAAGVVHAEDHPLSLSSLPAVAASGAAKVDKQQPASEHVNQTGIKSPAGAGSDIDVSAEADLLHKAVKGNANADITTTTDMASTERSTPSMPLEASTAPLNLLTEATNATSSQMHQESSTFASALHDMDVPSPHAPTRNGTAEVLVAGSSHEAIALSMDLETNNAPLPLTEALHDREKVAPSTGLKNLPTLLANESGHNNNTRSMTATDQETKDDSGTPPLVWVQPLRLSKFHLQPAYPARMPDDGAIIGFHKPSNSLPNDSIRQDVASIMRMKRSIRSDRSGLSHALYAARAAEQGLKAIHSGSSHGKIVSMQFRAPRVPYQILMPKTTYLQKLGQTHGRADPHTQQQGQAKITSQQQFLYQQSPSAIVQRSAAGVAELPEAPPRNMKALQSSTNLLQSMLSDGPPAAALRRLPAGTKMASLAGNPNSGRSGIMSGGSGVGIPSSPPQPGPLHTVIGNLLSKSGNPSNKWLHQAPRLPQQHHSPSPHQPCPASRISENGKSKIDSSSKLAMSNNRIILKHQKVSAEISVPGGMPLEQRHVYSFQQPSSTKDVLKSKGDLAPLLSGRPSSRGMSGVKLAGTVVANALCGEQKPFCPASFTYRESKASHSENTRTPQKAPWPFTPRKFCPECFLHSPPDIETVPGGPKWMPTTACTRHPLTHTPAGDLPVYEPPRNSAGEHKQKHFSHHHPHTRSESIHSVKDSHSHQQMKIASDRMPPFGAIKITALSLGNIDGLPATPPNHHYVLVFEEPTPVESKMWELEGVFHLKTNTASLVLLPDAQVSDYLKKECGKYNQQHQPTVEASVLSKAIHKAAAKQKDFQIQLRKEWRKEMNAWESQFEQRLLKILSTTSELPSTTIMVTTPPTTMGFEPAASRGRPHTDGHRLRHKGTPPPAQNEEANVHQGDVQSEHEPPDLAPPPVTAKRQNRRKFSKAEVMRRKYMHKHPPTISTSSTTHKPFGGSQSGEVSAALEDIMQSTLKSLILPGKPRDHASKYNSPLFHDSSEASSRKHHAGETGLSHGGGMDDGQGFAKGSLRTTTAQLVATSNQEAPDASAAESPASAGLKSRAGLGGGIMDASSGESGRLSIGATENSLHSIGTRIPGQQLETPRFGQHQQAIPSTHLAGFGHDSRMTFTTTGPLTEQQPASLAHLHPSLSGAPVGQTGLHEVLSESNNTSMSQSSMLPNAPSVLVGSHNHLNVTNSHGPAALLHPAASSPLGPSGSSANMAPLTDQITGNEVNPGFGPQGVSGADNANLGGGLAGTLGVVPAHGAAATGDQAYGNPGGVAPAAPGSVGSVGSPGANGLFGNQQQALRVHPPVPAPTTGSEQTFSTNHQQNVASGPPLSDNSASRAGQQPTGNLGGVSGAPSDQAVAATGGFSAAQGTEQQHAAAQAPLPSTDDHNSVQGSGQAAGPSVGELTAGTQQADRLSQGGFSDQNTITSGMQQQGGGILGAVDPNINAQAGLNIAPLTGEQPQDGGAAGPQETANAAEGGMPGDQPAATGGSGEQGTSAPAL